jgi:hypothetical protein
VILLIFTHLIFPLSHFIEFFLHSPIPYVIVFQVNSDADKTNIVQEGRFLREVALEG